MARIVENDKGFKIIALSHEEGESLGWGIWHRNDEDTEDICSFICCRCNKPIEGELYYVPVLNDLLDKDCYNKWYSTAINYPEDRHIGDNLFNYYKEMLNL